MGRFDCAPIVILLVAAASCGGAADGEGGRGAALFRSQACATCHGADGEGTAFGPTLHGKKAFWTREKLVEYLRNPQAYTEKDARLSAQARKYTLPMTRFDKLSQPEIEAVAEHVLAMP